MDFEKIAEEKIKEAMERGEFENIPGVGKEADVGVQVKEGD
jgi:hypothetical protein